MGTCAHEWKVSGDHKGFSGKFRKSRILTCAMRGLINPPTLLRPHIRGRKDPLHRVDQEEDEDPAVSRFRGILQPEWLDLVLVQVRECDASVSFRDHIANILHTRGVPGMNTLQFTKFGRRRWRVTYESMS